MENECWPPAGTDQAHHQHGPAGYSTMSGCSGADSASHMEDMRYGSMDHGPPHLLVPGSAASPPGAGGGGGSTASSGVSTGAVSPSGSLNNSSCCENGRPIMTDPVSGQTVCSCQYDSARLALSSYPRLSTGAGVYGTPYPSTDQNPYPSIDSTAFYSPLSNPYALKDGATSAEMNAWTSAGLQSSTGYYPYDPTLAAYGYGAGYDLAARRKNATRESTATLKAWLNEHKKNPYPTKGEKIMLAIITKMTLTQVSTWFANARRRLKKENKMTWEPKNKTDEDDDAILSDCDEKEKDEMLLMDEEKMKHHRMVKDPMMHVKSEHHLKDLQDEEDELEEEDERKTNMMGSHHHHHHHMLHHHHHHHNMMLKDEMKVDCGVPIPATKPKIWSLADTAACKTPPPSSLHNQQPWCNPGNPANPGMNMSINSINGFALPASSMSPSSGAPSSYSRYSGFFGNPYSNSMGHSQGHSNSNCGPVGGSGFSEVQTDTPPQTPPNMKVPNNVIAGSQQPSCFPSQSVVSPNNHPQASGGYSNNVQSHNPSNNNNTYSNNNNVFTQSPQKDRSESLSYHQHPSNNNNNNNPSAGAPPSNTDSTAFKPFYKSNPQHMNGNFVSPV